jgi:hypothetical protein
VTRTVALPDGTLVSSSSERWRHHCEALAICRMPTREKRQAHLDAVERLRGKPARRQLETTARMLWDRRRAGSSETS